MSFFTSSESKYFDSIINNDIETFKKYHKRYKTRYDKRQTILFGLTGLLGAIRLNRPEFVECLLDDEILLKTIAPISVQNIAGQIFQLATNTSTVQLAILMGREKILDIIRQYQIAHKSITKQLSEPNDDGYFNVHMLILCKSDNIYRKMIEHKTCLELKEIKPQKIDPFLFAIDNNCFEVIEMMLSYCKAYTYKEVMKESIIKHIQDIFQILNSKLLDSKIDQTKLAKIRKLIVDFTYDKYPNCITEQLKKEMKFETSDTSISTIDEFRLRVSSKNSPQLQIDFKSTIPLLVLSNSKIDPKMEPIFDSEMNLIDPQQVPKTKHTEIEQIVSRSVSMQNFQNCQKQQVKLDCLSHDD